MSEPLIVVVHRDAATRERLRRDVVAGAGLTVLAASDPGEAFALLEHHDHASVAAVLVEVDAVAPLRASGSRLAEAVTVVVTGFDRLDAAVAAIDEFGLATSLIEPWEAGHLAEILEDALFVWGGGEVAATDTVRVVGHRWARHSHDIKDFLGRNHVPHRWLDLDRGAEAGDVLESLGATPRLPAIILPDGRLLEDPTVDELADALGMHHHADRSYYDLAIVGGGPAGLSAAVYGASEGLSTVLVERDAPGGQAGTSSRIENYLGFPSGVSGAELASRALTQALRFGTEVLSPQTVEHLELDGRYKVVTLGDGRAVSAGSLIVATGVAYRPLHVPGLADLTGAGVYYGAATTEALAAEGEDVIVVGSANSAGQGAMYFAKFARSVTMIIRGPDLSANMSQYLIDQVLAAPKITVRADSHIVEAHGKDRLERVSIETAGAVEDVECRFLFVFIGAAPSNDWLGGLVAMDRSGYLLTGPDVPPEAWPLDRHPFHLETSAPGVFAAGDVRHGSIRRVAGGVGEGSTAVQLVHRYLATEH